MVAEGPAHLARIAEVARGLEELRHVWSIDGQRRRRADPARRGHLRRRARGAADDGDTPRPRHHHLHLGHDRTAQGLHAHPRQLHDRARRRGRRARRAVRPGATARPCSSCRWRTCSHGSSRSARSRRGSGSGHSADVKNLVRDLGQFQPTFVLAVPRVFEKIFNTASQNATADGRGRIFDRAAEVAIAWSRGLDRGKRLARRARPARGVLPARLRQAARGARRPLRVRRLRRRAARRAARPLLPRHRPDRARGLRPDRDDGRAHRQHARMRSRSARSAGRSRGRPSAWPTTASCSSGAARCSPATGATSRPPPRCWSATAGSTPATSARSTTRASSGSPAARRRSW